MNVQTATDHVASPYARMVASRGKSVADAEIARLENVVKDALPLLHASHPARVPLLVGQRTSAFCTSVEARLDVLSSAIVEAQRMVSPDSPVSAVLFLDECKRRIWPSYQAYVNDLERRMRLATSDE